MLIIYNYNLSSSLLFFLFLSLLLSNSVVADNWFDSKCEYGDCINGKGKYVTILGSYEGEWRNGKKHGYGINKSSDGKYEGWFNDDKRDGKGTFTRLDGVTLIAEWKNGIPVDWRGTLVFSFGKYVGGIILNNLKGGYLANGNGILTYSSGSKYEGEFKDDKINGNGTLTLKDGMQEIGEWKDNKLIKGVTVFHDGTKYEGEFVDGKLHGQGKISYQNGYQYSGELRYGIREGQGTCIWVDGSKYVGSWKNGKMDGIGTKTFPDGTQQTGEWKEDRLLSVAEVDLRRREEDAKATRDTALEAARIQADATAEAERKKREADEKIKQDALDIQRQIARSNCIAQVNACKSQCENLSDQIDEIKERPIIPDKKTSPRSRCKDACEQNCYF